MPQRAAELHLSEASVRQGLLWGSAWESESCFRTCLSVLQGGAAVFTAVPAGQGKC